MNCKKKAMKLIAMISAILLSALAGCDNYYHNLIPPSGDRIISFKVPGQVRAAMISDDAVMVTVKEGINVRSLLPEVTVSPKAKTLPVTFNYLQAAFPSADVLDIALGMYATDDHGSYITDLIKNNKDFNIPALNMAIDFSAPVDWYVISAQGKIRRYTVFITPENGNNPGGGAEWPKLLGIRFSKDKNPELPSDAFCWIFEDSRTVNSTVKYKADSDFSFALIPTFVILGDRAELNGDEITSDESVIQFDAVPGKQTKTLTLWRDSNAASYALNVTFEEDAGTDGPLLEGLRFAKYDNPELVIDAVCRINESVGTISARAYYPMEMSYLSFALSPAFEILGERLEVDGADVHSGDETSVIQFERSFGSQSKTLTVWRNGKSKDYTLTITFEEDPDTVRSITDFRFVKQDNPGIAANAVASIINTDNTGTITVQVFYSDSPPSNLIPRFVSPGTLTVSGAIQTTGASSQNFSSPVSYRVTSRNGQYVRTYTVKVTFVSLTDAAPRITSFRFSQSLNSGLVRDSDAEIRDDTGFVIINAYYGGTFAPELLTPEFTAEGMVQIMGSVQISAASPQDFNRPVKYTVVHPVNSLLKRDYWVYTTMVQDSSSHAVISSFSFHPDENPGLRDELTARIDQSAGKITVYAPIGSGVKARTMYPRFTAAGQVSVGGAAQVSGVSGQSFGGQVTYTVTSANGLNRRDYTVDVRELTSTMFVNQNAIGAGDGTSWENAFRYLQTACEAAAEFPADVPVEIWIASGTYTAGGVDDYFPLAPNTAYIGGFAGYETAKSQRNLAANETVISGGLGAGIYSKRLFYSPSEIGGDLSFENLRMSEVRGQEGPCVYAPLDSASEIEVTDCEINNTQASGAGGAIYVRGGGAVISRCSFSTCDNGAVYVQGKGAKIYDVEVSSCTGGNTGGITGAIRLDCSGETEIKRVNAADCSGIVFYLSGNGNKTLETLTANRVGQCLRAQNTTGYVSVSGLVMGDISGAGISLIGADGVKYFSGVAAQNINGYAVDSVASSGPFTITGNSTFDNTGAISVEDSSGTVSVYNTKITNAKGASALSVSANSAVIDSLTVDGVPNGRGITINRSGRTDITNTVIKNCVTNGSGGGISIEGAGSAGISNVTITACKASAQGGGMFLACSGNVSVSKTTIDSATITASGTSGGGIYRTGGSLSVENSVIKNITGSGTGCSGIYYSASANLEVSGLELQNIPGYGIYSAGNGVRKFSGITAVTNIGGEYGVYSGSMTSGNFSVTDSNFISCSVYCSASGASVPINVSDTDIRNVKGSSGLYANTGSGSVTIDWVNIDGVPNGRGIYAASSNTVRISNSTVKNCVTTGNGGGISISGSGSANISSTTITACKADSQGGGINLVCSGNVSVSNTTIDSVTITASGVSGGGIYRSGGSLSVVNSVLKNIMGNGAGCSGIYHSASANLEVSGLELQNIPGYGIYSSGNGVRKFSGITAVTNIGGEYGVYSTSIGTGSFSVTDSKFTSCGVYCNASGAVPITVTDTEIRNAKGSNGLCAVAGGGSVTIDKVIIDGVPNGRGIEASSDNTMRISNSTIKNCVTSGYGGGISISGAGSATFSNVTITVCKAVSYGGGMYIICSGDVSIADTTIDNVMLNWGEENIYHGHEVSFTVPTCDGVGIYRNTGSLSIVNSNIRNITDSGMDPNIAGYSSGIYYIASGNLTVSGLELQNISGDGIYSWGSGVRKFSGITATNIGGEGVCSDSMTSGSFSVTDSNFASSDVVCVASGAVPITVSDTNFLGTSGGVYLYTNDGGVTIDNVIIDSELFIDRYGISIESRGTIKISNSIIKNRGSGIRTSTIYRSITTGNNIEISGTTIKNCSYGLSFSGYATLTIDNIFMELCLPNNRYGKIISTGSKIGTGDCTITNSRFINCIGGDDGYNLNDNSLFLAAEDFTIISNCEFTHNAALPALAVSSRGYVKSLFGAGEGNFENCTFNNLKGDMPSGQNYIFNSWYKYPSYAPSGGVSGVVGTVSSKININLRNCTFNFNSGSAGLLALSSVQTTDGNHIDYLLMDGVTINNNNGQQPLIWLNDNRVAGTFQFKANNRYNGTLLNTQAAIVGLGSNVIRLTNGATPVLVP
ncbi:beta strand repeat-containing protein [Treponema sp. R80B11-R83G3]